MQLVDFPATYIPRRKSQAVMVIVFFPHLYNIKHEHIIIFINFQCLCYRHQPHKTLVKLCLSDDHAECEAMNDFPLMKMHLSSNIIVINCQLITTSLHNMQVYIPQPKF